MKSIAKKIIEANIEYHSKLVGDYREQPYINKKNIQRVRAILKRIAGQTGGKRLLDIGCGTGFIVNLAKDYFKEVVGLDITPAMLSKVSKAPNIKTVLAESGKIPFKDNYFNVCTAYSFLHHLHNLGPTIKEVSRVLAPKGIFYDDQDPNYYCYFPLEEIDKTDSRIINQELVKAKNLYKNYLKDYQIKKETIDLAEYQRKIKKGLKEEDLVKVMEKAGFKNIEIFYQWYLGQGQMEKKSSKEAANIDKFLQDLLPISKNLYKYLGFFARK